MYVQVSASAAPDTENTTAWVGEPTLIRGIVDVPVVNGFLTVSECLIKVLNNNDHGVDRKREGAVLRERAKSSQSLDLAMSHQTRTLLVPPEEELHGDDGTQCIWIGMLPEKADTYTFVALKGSKNEPKKGQAITESRSNIPV